MRPWAAECWPSSGDSCPDHQSSRPCASAPGPHWTSCPWWPSSPCPRCCPSTQRNLRPEESYAQEPRWKPTGPDIVILKYSIFRVCTYRSFRFLEAVAFEVDRFEILSIGRRWGLVPATSWPALVLCPACPHLGVQVEGRSLKDPELSRAVTSSVLDHLAARQLFVRNILNKIFISKCPERERELYELWDERKGTFLHILTLLFQISKTGQMLTKSRMTENMKHLTTQKDFFSKPQMADSVKYWQWPALLVTTWYKLNYSGPEGRPIVMGHFRLCKHDYVLSGRSTNHKSNPWKYRNGVSISQYLYFLPLLNIPRDNWKCETTKSTLHLRKKCFHF